MSPWAPTDLPICNSLPQSPSQTTNPFYPKSDSPKLITSKPPLKMNQTSNGLLTLDLRKPNPNKIQTH